MLWINLSAHLEPYVSNEFWFTNVAGTHWSFFDSQGVTQQIPINSRIKINSARAVREMLLRGEGIGLCPSFAVADCLQRKSLVRLMSELTYQKQKFPVNALYVNNRYLPEKSRAFSQFVMELVKTL
ncbi:LysR substrate-binding domain-containing protein [Endozoicomonas ascidiicola]|uniref:LysR substrate-binding domain-containing protein n=1 Tax=Endozoicomonas ascidiicola TaxID=1698521 RepID=UPI000829E43A|nr:LysR substrate-binding domain-containing protein [Endozoicomonas ascidiicola]